MEKDMSTIVCKIGCALIWILKISQHFTYLWKTERKTSEREEPGEKRIEEKCPREKFICAILFYIFILFHTYIFRKANNE